MADCRVELGLPILRAATGVEVEINYTFLVLYFYYCVTVLLCYCVTVLLCYCITVLLRTCTVLSNQLQS